MLTDEVPPQEKKYMSVLAHLLRPCLVYVPYHQVPLSGVFLCRFLSRDFAMNDHTSKRGADGVCEGELGSKRFCLTGAVHPCAASISAIPPLQSTFLQTKGENSDLESGAGEEPSSPTGKQKGKEKQKRRSAGRGRRSRREEEVEREPQLDADGNPIPKTLRYPKRQCALLLGFCGSEFNGMQMYGMLFFRVLTFLLYFPVSLASQTSRQSKAYCSMLW
jgi:hypothetical protein